MKKEHKRTLFNLLQLLTRQGTGLRVVAQCHDAKLRELETRIALLEATAEAQRKKDLN